MISCKIPHTRDVDGKSNLLRKIATELFDNNRNVFDKILKNLPYSEEDVIKAYILHSLDINFTNDIYKNPALRFAMYMLHFLKGSWHARKQDFLKRSIEKYNFNNTLDLGFGTPSPYNFEILNKKGHLTLVDFAEHAIDFAKKIFEIEAPESLDRITLKNCDIQLVDKLIGNYDAYFFLDSIEHLPEAKRTLSNYAEKSYRNAYIVLSLPICELIPVHYITWHTEEECKEWINSCNLQILESEIISVTPHIDLFAEQLNYKDQDFLAVCKYAEF